MTEDLFDETTWVPPTEFPDLSTEKIIAIDVETRDPNLLTYGPGWPRNDGELIGIAVAADGWQDYFPIAHKGGGNLAKNMVLDTMIAAPLLDENRFSYSLSALGSTYLGERKQEEDLRRAAGQHGVDAKKEMWKLPAARVALYAETDARLTLELWNILHPKLIEDNCEDILKLELSLLPIVFEMRRRGVRVDLEQAQAAKTLLEGKEKKLLQEVEKETGVLIEPWNATSLSKAFDSLDLSYNKTEKTKAPSFTKHFLQTHTHPIPVQGTYPL